MIIFWCAFLLSCSLFSLGGFLYVIQGTGLWDRAPAVMAGLVVALAIPPAVTAIAAARIGLRRMVRMLRERPDSEHEQAILRIVMPNVILAYVLTLGIWPEFRPHQVEAVLILVVAGGVSWFILQHILLCPRPSIPRRLLGNVADVGLISAFLHIAGAPAAPWYLIYLWVTFGNGFRFGTPFLFSSTVFSAIGFLWVIQTTEYWREIPHVAFGLLAALMVLPAYVARLIRQLTEAKAQAEAANRSKGRFLATVSHELRTPLTAIIGMSDMMMATRLDSEQREMSATIMASARQLLSLITDILDFSQIEEAKLAIDRTEFDLQDVLNTTRLVLRGQARGKGLDLRLLIDAAAPKRVIGDPRRLQQALTNLVGNAVKFTERGEVVLALRQIRRSGDEAVLEFRVTDTGIGIDPNHLERIFDRFTQADDEINRRYGGTGLGLAISKQLVELMGGSIEVTSEPGRGSSFCITIPMHIRPAPPADIPSSGLTAVVVGEGMADRVAGVLARHRMTVRQASNLDDLRRLLDSLRLPDAHTLLVLPDGTEGIGTWLAGPDVTERLTVLLVGVPADEAARRTRGWHVDTVLTSEPDPAAIDRAVDTVCAAVATAPAPSVPAPVPTGARYRVLVAEDNPVNRRVLQKILERAGHEAVFARDGDEALDRLDEGGFDAVLMDMNMPGTSGLDVARIYRFTHTDRAHLPIIALTAEATETARRDCAEAGMDAFLTKPIEPQKLFATIETLVGDKAGSSPEKLTVAEAAPAPMADEPSIDQAAFAKLRAIDPDPAFISQISAEFLADAEELLFELERAWATNDLPAFKEHAHSLRSSASYIGALRLVRLLHACRDLSRDDLPDGGHRLVRQAREEFVQVRNSLQVWL